jgi:hypothetical protein
MFGGETTEWIGPADYFSFTKSRTKIAHTPTVAGNCTNCASRIPLPRGSRKLSPSIANAVSIPRANLVLEFIVVSTSLSSRESCDEHHPRKLSGVQLLSSWCRVASWRTLQLGYWMMITFMLQGVRVRSRGRVCAPMLVTIGGAQVLVPAGSGGVPVGEPDRS